jgi:hypothetical protein
MPYTILTKPIHELTQNHPNQCFVVLRVVWWIVLLLNYSFLTSM